MDDSTVDKSRLRALFFIPSENLSQSAALGCKQPLATISVRRRNMSARLSGTIEWSPAYSIEIPSIDSQHRLLVSIIGQLQEAML